MCPETIQSTVTTDVTVDPSKTCWETPFTTKTQTVLSIEYTPWDNDWENTAIYDDFMGENGCLPQVRHNDPGYALLR